MITLGFDTSGAHSSAALHRDGDILASRHEDFYASFYGVD